MKRVKTLYKPAMSPQEKTKPTDRVSCCLHMLWENKATTEVPRPTSAADRSRRLLNPSDIRAKQKVFVAAFGIKRVFFIQHITKSFTVHTGSNKRHEIQIEERLKHVC